MQVMGPEVVAVDSRFGDERFTQRVSVHVNLGVNKFQMVNDVPHAQDVIPASVELHRLDNRKNDTVGERGDITLVCKTVGRKKTQL